jgi:hypothetical protein
VGWLCGSAIATLCGELDAQRENDAVMQPTFTTKPDARK